MNNRGNFGGIGGFGLFPPMLKSLLIINIVVFVLQHFLLSSLTFSNVPLGEFIIKFFALWPFNVPLEYQEAGMSFKIWQLFTYQFMHGDFWHLFMNMFALWMFGSELENLWGSKKFIVYYLIAGIGAGIIHLLISPYLSPAIRPTVGASGSIYGILLAFGLTFPKRPIFMFPLFIPIPAKYFVIIFGVFELISGLGGNDGIAHFAHLGGALTGFLLLKFGSKIPYYNRLEPKNLNVGDHYQDYEYTQPRKESSPFKVNWSVTTKPIQNTPSQHTTASSRQFVVDGEIITQSIIDSLLDKISNSGFQSLSEKEKRILTEVSKQL